MFYRLSRQGSSRWAQLGAHFVCGTLLGVLLMIATGASICHSRSDCDTGKPKTEASLPKHVRDAWKAAGFRYGWLTYENGLPRFVDDLGLERGELVALSLRSWRKGLIGRLPIPAVTFGLDLTNSEDALKINNEILGEISVLRNVVALCFDASNVTDEGLESLVGLKDLRVLVFLGGTVNERGLRSLARLTNLDKLAFFGTELADSAFPRLKHVSALTFEGFTLSKAAAKRLGDLTQVHELELRGVDLTDDDLSLLVAQGKIRSLNISHNKLTDAGLVHIGKIETLRSLSLRRTEIGDEGLKSLARLRELEVLDLDNTRVTDVGLKALAPLVQLRAVSVHECMITDDGVAMLQRALPKLKINRTARRGYLSFRQAWRQGERELELVAAVCENLGLRRTPRPSSKQDELTESCPPKAYMG